MRVALKVTAKYMGRNCYEITAENEKEVIKFTKNKKKFSHNVNEVSENFSIKGIYVLGREIAEAIQAITTMKIPMEFIY